MIIIPLSVSKRRDVKFPLYLSLATCYGDWARDKYLFFPELTPQSIGPDSEDEKHISVLLFSLATMPCTESVTTGILSGLPWVFFNQISDKVISLLYLLMERVISVSWRLGVMGEGSSHHLLHKNRGSHFATFIFLRRCTFVHSFFWVC